MYESFQSKVPVLWLHLKRFVLSQNHIFLIDSHWNGGLRAIKEKDPPFNNTYILDLSKNVAHVHESLPLHMQDVWYITHDA